MSSKACQDCCDCFKWVAVVFITAIIGWSYYAYVVQMCILTIDTLYEKVIFMLIYHLILILFMSSYYRTAFSKPRKPTNNFFLEQTEWQRLEGETNENVQKELLENYARTRTLPTQNTTHAGLLRYCEKCKCIKPDRCHHCSVCRSCVLKMDHHCPWVANCVGFHNYKFFVLFLGYGFLYCMYVALSSCKYFLAFWSGSKDSGTGMGRFHILFLFFLSVMFCIPLLSLFGYHLYLTLNNRSTLEAFRAPIFQTGPDKNGFSLGSRKNWIQVFGEKPSLWFLPIFTSCGDGMSFVSRQQPTINYNAMCNTPNLTNGTTGNQNPDTDGILDNKQELMEGNQDANHIIVQIAS